MTVAALGPGAVGGALAVRLAEAGVDVVCVRAAGDGGRDRASTPRADLRV